MINLIQKYCYIVLLQPRQNWKINRTNGGLQLNNQTNTTRRSAGKKGKKITISYNMLLY